MKKILFAVVIFCCILAGTLYYIFPKRYILINPLGRPKSLLAYTFDTLKKTSFPKTQITFGEKTLNSDTTITQLFYYQTPIFPGSENMERVSGLMNMPNKPGVYPVIVMFRGFIPPEKYTPGAGTQSTANVLAEHGFITLAPDFLGFGQSASPSSILFEDRFQTYTTSLSLLSSLPTLNDAFTASYSGIIQADLSKIGVWGHSNGGHIALSFLTLTGKPFPTVLWAPVSKSFPYSILYYADESDDQGKALRKALSHFEETYDTNLFSPPNYYSYITAPLEIHQGTNDEEVPLWWSNSLVKTLQKQGLPVTYIVHPGADHNLLPSSWNDAVSQTVDFYTSQFAK